MGCKNRGGRHLFQIFDYDKTDFDHDKTDFGAKWMDGMPDLHGFSGQMAES
jgi:hypothetical protein